METNEVSILIKINEYKRAKVAHQKAKDEFDEATSVITALIDSLDGDAKVAAKELAGLSEAKEDEKPKSKGMPSEAARKLLQSKIGTGHKQATIDIKAKREIAEQAKCTAEDVTATLKEHYKNVRKPGDKGISNLWTNKA